MIPMAIALNHGSEANAPLGRAILGGLIAGEPATLFVLPALYSLLVHDRTAQRVELPPPGSELVFCKVRITPTELQHAHRDVPIV
jgi:hypothetical protein